MPSQSVIFWNTLMLWEFLKHYFLGVSSTLMMVSNSCYRNGGILKKATVQRVKMNLS